MSEHEINLANVYGAHPEIIVGGDAHRARRRVGTVQERVDGSWVTLGRTTSVPPQGDPYIESDVDQKCQLDKPGWWSLRFQHTLEAAIIGNEVYCPHYGALADSSAKALLEFWELHKYG